MKRFFPVFLAFLWLFPLAYSQKQKVIFDCDLGGDIDDAFALALLLNCRDEFDILGITLDHGETMGRARIACKMLYLTGLEEIPFMIYLSALHSKPNALRYTLYALRWNFGTLEPWNHGTLKPWNLSSLHS